jgi:hypothetical protein
MSAEEKCTSYKLDLLAIIKAIKILRVYLLRVLFKISTDCKIFAIMIKEKKEFNEHIARWFYYWRKII